MLRLLLCFGATVTCGSLASAADVPVTSCGEIATAISYSPPGTRILLPNQECTISARVLVPSGVTIVGGPLTLLSAEFPGGASEFVFDLRSPETAEPSSDVEFRSFAMRLGANAKGIGFDGGAAGGNACLLAPGGSRVTLSDLTIEGSNVAPGTSGVPISMCRMKTVLVERVQIRDSFGGIYVTDSTDVRIQNNTLKKTNFGNIVVSGTRIWVLNNSIDQPGYAPVPMTPSGDGITLTGSSYITVSNNTIRNGFCYGIAAFTPGSTQVNVSNAEISGNTITTGTTSAIYLEQPAGVTITGNVLRQNASGWGVALTSPSYVVVASNAFYGDRLFVDSSWYGKYVSNTFLLWSGSSPITYTGNGDVVGPNY